MSSEKEEKRQEHLDHATLLTTSFVRLYYVLGKMDQKSFLGASLEIVKLADDLGIAAEGLRKDMTEKELEELETNSKRILHDNGYYIRHKE